MFSRLFFSKCHCFFIQFQFDCTFLHYFFLLYQYFKFFSFFSHKMFISYEYIFILFFFFINSLIFILLVGVAFICGKRVKDFSKLSGYECGFKSFSDTRRPFDVHFYLISILYLVFDVEVLYLFPFVVSIPTLNFFGFFSVFLFLILIIIGFIFDWRQNSLA